MRRKSVENKNLVRRESDGHGCCCQMKDCRQSFDGVGKQVNNRDHRLVSVVFLFQMNKVKEAIQRAREKQNERKEKFIHRIKNNDVHFFSLRI